MKYGEQDDVLAKKVEAALDERANRLLAEKKAKDLKDDAEIEQIIRGEEQAVRVSPGVELEFEFEFEFGANNLDERNWVVDFGGLKDLETWLRSNFDHKTLVASDDPKLPEFKSLNDNGIIDIVIVESTGAEMFAKMAMEFSSKMIQDIYGDRCWVESVTVREHGANSAKCKREV